jgi:hypothetical protein
VASRVRMTKREWLLGVLLAVLGGPFFVSVLLSRVEVAGVDVPRWVLLAAATTMWFGGTATQLRPVRIVASFVFMQSATIGFGWRESFFMWWLLQSSLFLTVAVLLELYLYPGARRGPEPPVRQPAIARRAVRIVRTAVIHDRRRAARR